MIPLARHADPPAVGRETDGGLGHFVPTTTRGGWRPNPRTVPDAPCLTARLAPTTTTANTQDQVRVPALIIRATLRRRLAQGAFPHAAQDTSGAWTVPVGDLLAAGLRVHAPQVAGAQAPPVVSRGSGPVHRLPAGAGEQGHGDARERALATRVAELERALAVAEMRAEGAERLAAERAARIDDLRGALRMLEAAPRTSAGDGGPPRWRRWWR